MLLACCQMPIMTWAFVAYPGHESVIQPLGCNSWYAYPSCRSTITKLLKPAWPLPFAKVWFGFDLLNVSEFYSLTTLLYKLNLFLAERSKGNLGFSAQNSDCYCCGSIRKLPKFCCKFASLESSIALTNHFSVSKVTIIYFPPVWTIRTRWLQCKSWAVEQIW